MFTKDNIKNALMDNGVTFFVLPTNAMKEHIVKCDDPDINSLSQEVKSIFLEGKGLTIENKMIADYIEGKLDSKNSKVISLCEIRVLQDRVPII